MVNFKESEIGRIPSDWDVLPIDDNFDFLQNNTYARDCLNDQSGMVHNIHYGDVLIKFGSILDCNKDAIPFINPDITPNLMKRLVQSGDIIIADTAEDNTVGKAVEVVGVGKMNIVSGLHTIFIRPHEGLFTESFLGYLINSAVYHDQLIPYITGTKVSSVSKASLRETFVVRPSIHEQRRIAAALSDMDGYIAALEKLIAKKRDIKKGAMQDLLTGKRRLPGFSGEWVEKRIEDFPAVVVSGGTPSTFHPEYWGGSIPWMNSGELNLKRVHRVEGRITQLGFDNSSTTMVEAKSVLIGLAGQGKTRGTVAMNYFGLCTNQSIAAILPNPSVYCSEYLYQNLDSRYDELREISTGDGGRGGLNLTILRNLYVPFPTLTEQSAIADILSDMDAEIDALTAKLSKARNIKQGMMQQLLTGRIRLVPEETVTKVMSEKSVEKIIEFQKLDPEVDTTQRVGHNKAIEDAVILAVIVDLYATEQYPLTPFYAQKFPYLLHRHMEGIVKGYHKFAAGPYNAGLKYKTALPIAKKNKYIVTKKETYKGKSYQAMLVGDNIEQAKGYFTQWHGDEPLKWLEQFRYIKNRRDELELLATVDMALMELRTHDASISVQAVKGIIQSSEEWKAKLKREIFSDANIARAIKWSGDLFGTEEIIHGEN